MNCFGTVTSTARAARSSRPSEQSCGCAGAHVPVPAARGRRGMGQGAHASARRLRGFPRSADARDRLQHGDEGGGATRGDLRRSRTHAHHPRRLGEGLADAIMHYAKGDTAEGQARAMPHWTRRPTRRASSTAFGSTGLPMRMRVSVRRSKSSSRAATAWLPSAKSSRLRKRRPEGPSRHGLVSRPDPVSRGTVGRRASSDPLSRQRTKQRSRARMGRSTGWQEEAAGEIGLGQHLLALSGGEETGCSRCGRSFSTKPDGDGCSPDPHHFRQARR